MTQRRILITFSGERYHDSTKLIVDGAQRFGATEPAWVFDDIWLKTKRPEHCAATKWAFDHPKVRGINWFCWKPFLLIDALKRCQDGDTVLFTDADCWPISDMSPIYDIADRDGAALFAACGHKQRQWSKRDTQIIQDMDCDFFRDMQAGCARFMVFKKGGTIRTNSVLGMKVDRFLVEWLIITMHPQANTFDKSVLAEEYTDGFIEARCEQAILTNIANREAIKLHRECDQWGQSFKADFPNDTYQQIFESTGVYSYDPSGKRDGSSFRNVHE